jgi:hypothetical protein
MLTSLGSSQHLLLALAVRLMMITVGRVVAGDVFAGDDVRGDNGTLMVELMEWRRG